jgi:hypothetical protein
MINRVRFFIYILGVNAMKITIPLLADQETLTFEDDILNRKPFAEMLTNLVQGGEESLVMSIDAQWGEGKTTFVKMWKGLLEEKNIPNVYIDTFENDYVDDAFILLVNNILEYADSQKTRSDKIKEGMQTFVKHAFLVSRRFAIWGAGVAVKGLTSNAIDAHEIEKLKAIADDVADGVYGATKEALEGILQSHKESIEAVQGFKDALSNLPRLLASPNVSESPADAESVPPLVIIIDELDRCKPTFAVEVIERVKHLFSVKNVVFVLVMNKTQLEGSIEAVYGSSEKFSAHTYLQKFITVETRLPKEIGPLDDPSEYTHKQCSDYFSYSRYLIKQHELEQYFRKVNGPSIVGYTSDLVMNCDLSLRQMENVFTNLTIFYKTQENINVILQDAVILLSVIKVIKPDLLMQIANNDIDYDQINKVIDFSQHPRDKNVGTRHFRSFVKYCLLSEAEVEADDDKDMILSFDNHPDYSEYDQHQRRKLLRLCAQRLLWFSAS